MNKHEITLVTNREHAIKNRLNKWGEITIDVDITALTDKQIAIYDQIYKTNAKCINISDYPSNLSIGEYLDLYQADRDKIDKEKEKNRMNIIAKFKNEFDDYVEKYESDKNQLIDLNHNKYKYLKSPYINIDYRDELDFDYRATVDMMHANLQSICDQKNKELEFETELKEAERKKHIAEIIKSHCDIDTFECFEKELLDESEIKDILSGIIFERSDSIAGIADLEIASNTTKVSTVSSKIYKAAKKIIDVLPDGCEYSFYRFEDDYRFDDEDDETIYTLYVTKSCLGHDLYREYLIQEN